MSGRRALLISGLVLFVAALLTLYGCVRSRTTGAPLPEVAGGPLVAVFPIENLSGKAAPLADIRHRLIDSLQSRGVRVLDDATLDAVLTRYRVRYTAGLEQKFAEALKRDSGVDGVVIASVEFFDPTPPPRVALFVRFVATGQMLLVRWIDSVGLAGDDSPGVLGIGMIDDVETLLARGVNQLTASLVRYLEAGESRRGQSTPRKFRPKVIYRSDTLDSSRTYSVAVMPFFSRTDRPNAGEIIALHMIQSLLSFAGLGVVEPGVVREELLRSRIIMSDGVSIPETETVLNAVNADLVLNGEVLRYAERAGVSGAPSVDFGVLFIERRSRRVVYSSYSHNTGNDGVFFFDVGRVNTAHAMASDMARSIAQRMLLRSASASPSTRADRVDGAVK